MKITKRMVPDPVRRLARRSPLYVRHRSEADVVYHLCVQKTASQWVRRVLTDERVYRASGLRPFDYYRKTPAGGERQNLKEMSLDYEIPLRSMVSPLYLSRPAFDRAPKPPSWRAFFVMRDPRDIVVSWYFSMRNSHAPMDGRLDEIRAELRDLDREEGLKHAIWALTNRARLFEALGSWVGEDDSDPRVLLVRYEDLVGPDQAHAWEAVFAHCDIRLSRPDQKALLDKYAFQRLAGRPRGEEDQHHHFRKGEPGDWRNHLQPGHVAFLREVTGDLVERLHYDAE